jgi:hypothetical protein
MKCVICNRFDADSNISFSKTIKIVTCSGCRSDNYPEYMPNTQYIRYWNLIHEKHEEKR